MKNGNAFLAFTEKTIGFLEEKEIMAYFREPLPSATDEAIFRIVGRFLTATRPQRETFQTALSQKQRALFGIFGHRAATLSVRKESREWLQKGLAGTVISNYIVPENRKVEVGLAVLHHCARKLGMNTVDLFEQAATYAAPDLAARLTAFGRRSDVTLNQFGWQEQNTPEGVKYKFSWG